MDAQSLWAALLQGAVVRRMPSTPPGVGPPPRIALLATACVPRRHRRRTSNEKEGSMLARTLRTALTAGLLALAAAPGAAQDFQSPTVEPYRGPYPAAMPAVVSPQAATVQAATQVLTDVTAIPDRGIPHALLTHAQAVAIVPNVIKIGLIAGVRHGNGVILVRDAQGAWGPPQFVSLTGGSIGFQAGAQSTDVVLVFRNRETVDAMMRGKITLGADAAVAAGPVGRRAEVGTDLQLKAEIFSYSRNRGLFAGVSLDGASLKADSAATQIYYARGEPAEAVQLQQLVAAVSQMEPAEAAVIPAPTMPTDAVPADRSVLVPANPADAALAARQQLAASWKQLEGRLDDAWRRYLALPPEVFADGPPPSVEALGRALQAYQTVAENPQYRAVAQMPEFQAALARLRSAIVAQVNAPAPSAGSQGPPALPPPPAR